MATDHNLLFGILALQLDFIKRDELLRATSAWILDKTKPLGQIWQSRGSAAATPNADRWPREGAFARPPRRYSPEYPGFDGSSRRS